MATVRKEDFVVTNQSGAALRVLLELRAVIQEHNGEVGNA